MAGTWDELTMTLDRLSCARAHVAKIEEQVALMVALLDEAQTRREALRRQVRGEE